MKSEATAAFAATLLAAVSPSSAPPSIIVAHWLRYRDLGEPPGCGGQNLLCKDALVEAHMDAATTLAGPRVPQLLTIGFVAGGEMARSGRLPLLVVRNRFRRHAPWLGFYL